MRRTPRGGLLLLVFGMVLATAGRLHAATFVVNSANDIGDGICDAAHCSLRDAITEANASAGADRIEFAILPSGVTHTISTTVALPPITDAVEIDGYTQSGAQANTIIERVLDSVLRIDLVAGAPLAVGLRIESSNVTIRGLAVRGYETNISIADTSTSVIIAGNYIGTAADGLTDSTSAYGIRCDLCAGVTIGGSAPEDHNLISGNHTAGIATARPAGSTPFILAIRGNLIGTNRLATTAIPNGYGIHLYTPSTASTSADRVEIGGFEEGQLNIIAGNTSDGIYVQRTAGFDVSAARLWIILNLIGTTDYDATPVLGNGGAGVVTAGMVKAMVSSNRVAHNGGKGLVVRGTTTPNGSGVLLRNLIVDNAGLGIDLGDDGRTANDADDSDTGANGLLNFPVLTSAGVDPGSGILTVSGTVQGPPNTRLDVDIYNNGPTSRPNGYDAITSVTSGVINTDAGGVASFTFTKANGGVVGDKLVAILHDAGARGLSSEISDPLVVTVAPPSISGQLTRDQGNILENAEVRLTGTENRIALTDPYGRYSFLNLTVGGNYTVTPESIGYTFAPASRSYTNLTSSQIQDFFATPGPAIYTVNVTHDAGDGPCTLAECTLREALTAANNHPGADTIRFAITGAGPHVLLLNALMPSVDSDLVIDGYTQPGAFPNANATGGLNGAIKIGLQPSGLPGSGSTGLAVRGSRVTVRGLAITGFGIGISVGNQQTPPVDVVIAGNYIGTSPDGLSAISSGGFGVFTATAVGLTLGGSTPAARNLISGFEVAGVFLKPGTGGRATNIIVRGNLIGTDVSGQVALPNELGISYSSQLETSEADVLWIGGDAAGEGNVISGNTTQGLTFSRGTGSDRDDSDQQIIGNLIGVAGDGTTPLGNAGEGVSIGSRSKLRLARNTIAHNGSYGVWVLGDPTATGRGTELSENHIFANGDMAIALSTTPRPWNDPGDADPGPNNRQNYPVLTSMVETLAGTTLTGTFNSLPNRTYRIELFTTGGVASVGFHAREFVRGFLVTTDADGNAPLSQIFTTAFAATERFTATATDVDAMMTSELSDDVAITADIRADVTATVTLNDAPLNGVDIAVTGDRQITQPTVNGTVTFSLPVGGSYVLTPSLAGYVFTPSSAPVTTLAGATTVAFVARHAAFTRYLPEGATGAFWKTSISLLNAGSVATTADVSFLLENGTRKELTIPLSGPDHVVIDPATIEGLESATFATIVSAAEPLTVSRTTRWGGESELGAHAEQAVNEPRTSWFFAEGTTGCFDLFYLLVNPGATLAEVDITFVRRAPLTPIVRHYQVGAFSRATIAVNGEEGLAGAEVSARIEVPNGQPIVAERAMYSRCFGEIWRGGHDAAASASTSTDWFFAEGATGGFFDSYLLLANFEAQPANVEVAYLLENGSTVTKPYEIPAMSRVTLDVANEAPELAQASVSTVMRSTNGIPVVAERAQWWPHGQWYEGHVSAGATLTGIEWQIAGAEVGGAANTESFLLIANTASDAGSVEVRVIYGDGTTETLAAPLALAPRSRTTVSLSTAFPNAAARIFGVVVESLGTTPVPIVVELSTYGNTAASATTPFRFWGLGTNLVATRVR